MIIDHVCFAVPDLDAAVAYWETGLRLPATGRRRW